MVAGAGVDETVDIPDQQCHPYLEIFLVVSGPFTPVAGVFMRYDKCLSDV